MSDTPDADLSSDILERQFGPSRVEVLTQDYKTRVIRTLAGGRTLELSFVIFRGAAARFADIHGKVLGGESMGKAFRASGVAFSRRTNAIHTCEPPPAFRRRFGMPGPATVVEVSILAGRDSAHYADILEVYSPAVEWPEPGAPITKPAEARLKEFDSLLTQLAD